MKSFLSELGSCYRPSSAAAAAARPPQPPPPPPELAEATITIHVARSRSESGATNRQWQPALVPISEEAVSAVSSNAKVHDQSQNIKSKAKPRTFSYNDQCYPRRSKAPMIIPAAFSPTPFMF